MKRGKKGILFSGLLMLLMFTFLIGCSSNQASNNEQSSSTENNGGSESKTEASADDFPNKPITIVVPFSAGGAGDTMSRTFAKIAEPYLGQTMIIDNKDGASGAIALQQTLSKEADGYTILYQSATLPLTMASGQIPFTPDDVVPIATILSNYQVLAVPADSPFQTLEDFIQHAKENPGALKVGGSGMNSTNHVFALKIMDGAGVELGYVSYNGGSETITAILGGNIDAVAVSGEVVQQQVDEGNLRILAVSSSERFPGLPDVPTFKELGYTNIDDELIWRGFFAKPGTPQERIDKIAEIIPQVMEDPEWQEYIKNTNQDPYYKTGEDVMKTFNESFESGKALFEKYKSN